MNSNGTYEPKSCPHYDMRIYLTPGDAEYPDTIYSIRCHNCDTFTKVATTRPVTIADCRAALTARVQRS